MNKKSIPHKVINIFIFPGFFVTFWILRDIVVKTTELSPFNDSTVFLELRWDIESHGLLFNIENGALRQEALVLRALYINFLLLRYYGRGRNISSLWYNRFQRTQKHILKWKCSHRRVYLLDVIATWHLSIMILYVLKSSNTATSSHDLTRRCHSWHSSCAPENCPARLTRRYLCTLLPLWCQSRPP